MPHPLILVFPVVFCFQRSHAAGTAALPRVESVPNQSKASGVNPHGPIRPHGPIHGIMPHESVSPRHSARRRQLVPTVPGVPWNRQYQWLTDYQKRSLFSDISREVSAHGIILLSLSFFIGTTTNYLRLNPQTHIHPCLPAFTPYIGQVVPRDNTSPKIRQEYNHEHPPPLIYPH